jgi:tetrahydromethanopterin S-methyltransferase subunit H
VKPLLVIYGGASGTLINNSRQLMFLVGRGRAPNNNGIEVGSVSHCGISAWQTFQELKRRDGVFKKLLVDAVIGLLSFKTNKLAASSFLFLGQQQMARLYELLMVLDAA